MYVRQADFFRETRMGFINKVMKLAVRRSCESGELLFEKGQAAENFYVLLEGRVHIRLGATANVVYIVSRAGEAFGWSSMVGRSAYSATAQCIEPTTLFVFERDRVVALIEEDPRDGLIVYKRLAETLANRLLESYRVIEQAERNEKPASAGSGQFRSADATTGESVLIDR